jgi:hypothetical protein
MRWAGRIALAALVLAMLALGWASFVGLPFKQHVEQVISRASGRQVSIGGPLRLVFLPRPGVVAEQVSVRGPGPVTEIVAGRVEVVPDLATLLAGRIRPARVFAGDAFLVAEGQALPGFVLPRLSLVWTDSPDPDRRIEVSGRIASSASAAPFVLTGTLADPDALSRNDHPWPFSLRIASDEAQALGLLAGTVRQRRLAQVDASFIAPRLDGLSAHLPDLELPAVRDVGLAVRLETTGTRPAIRSLSVQAGEGVPDPTVPWLRLAHLRIRAEQPDQPILFEVRGTLQDTPWFAAGDVGTLEDWLRNGPVRLALNAGVDDAMEGQARLTILRSGRPSVQGEVTLEQLDVARLRALVPGPSATAAEPGPPPAPRPTRRSVIPDVPLPVAPVQAIDLNLDLQVAAIRSGDLVIEDVVAALRWRDGIARIEDVFARLLGGTATGRATLDATEGKTAAALSVRLAGIRMEQLATLAGVPSAVTAAVDAELVLAGPGETLPRWLAQASGMAALSSEGGAIDGGWLVGILPPAVQQVLPFDQADRRLRCLAMRLDIVRGTGVVNAMLLEGAGLRLAGTGRVSFADEALDLPMRVQAPGIGNPTLPGVLAGPWHAPRLRLDAAAGLAALLPGRREDMPDCPSSLSVARGAPALPAQPAAPPVPGLPDRVPGLLRDLLRR